MDETLQRRARGATTKRTNSAWRERYAIRPGAKGTNSREVSTRRVIPAVRGLADRVVVTW